MWSQVSDRSHGSNVSWMEHSAVKYSYSVHVWARNFIFFVRRGSLFDSNSNINQSARFVHCQNCPPLGGYFPKIDNSQTSEFQPEQYKSINSNLWYKIKCHNISRWRTRGLFVCCRKAGFDFALQMLPDSHGVQVKLFWQRHVTDLRVECFCPVTTTKTIKSSIVPMCRQTVVKLLLSKLSAITNISSTPVSKIATEAKTHKESSSLISCSQINEASKTWLS